MVVKEIYMMDKEILYIWWLRKFYIDLRKLIC